MFSTHLIKRRAVDLCRVGSCLCRLS
ncbi:MULTISPECIES: Ms5788A family Cys-rich leader peptide [Pseudofrankia]